MAGKECAWLRSCQLVDTLVIADRGNSNKFAENRAGRTIATYKGRLLYAVDRQF